MTVGTTPALAYTDCQVILQRMYAGDGGNIWFIFTNGGSAYLVPGDPDMNATTAFGLTALSGGRTLVVRYNANSVSCTSTDRTDLIGIYIY